MRRRERDGCGTFRFFEVSSRGATAHHTPPRQWREEGRKYSFRRRDTVDARTRRNANGENFTRPGHTFRGPILTYLNQPSQQSNLLLTREAIKNRPCIDQGSRDLQVSSLSAPVKRGRV